VRASSFDEASEGILLRPEMWTPVLRSPEGEAGWRAVTGDDENYVYAITL
jgi:hypothetical protein